MDDFKKKVDQVLLSKGYNGPDEVIHDLQMGDFTIQLEHPFVIKMKNLNFFVSNEETGEEMIACPMRPCIDDVSKGVCKTHFLNFLKYRKEPSRNFVDFPVNMTQADYADQERVISAIAKLLKEESGIDWSKDAAKEISFRKWLQVASENQDYGFKVNDYVINVYQFSKENFRITDSSSGTCFNTCATFPRCCNVGNNEYLGMQYCHKCLNDNEHVKTWTTEIVGLREMYKNRCLRILMERANPDEPISMKNDYQWRKMLKWILESKNQQIKVTFNDNVSIHVMICDYGRLNMQICVGKRERFKSLCLAANCGKVCKKQTNPSKRWEDPLFYFCQSDANKPNSLLNLPKLFVGNLENVKKRDISVDTHEDKAKGKKLRIYRK